MLANLVLILAVSQSHAARSLAQAADSIARGEDVESASARLVRAGQRGLWLAHDRAKNEQGEARTRLFETVGRFGTSEAEWALVHELKSGPTEGRLGALRGLQHVKSASARASLLRYAPSVQADLRGALAESLVESGGLSEQQVRALLDHESSAAREVALAYLARAEPSPLAREAAATALADASPEVVVQALSLAAHLNDSSLVYSIGDIARSGADPLADRAVESMARIDGRATVSELGSIVAFDRTPAAAWHRAAEVLANRDRIQLVRAMARASDGRRHALARLGAGGVQASDLAPVIELLDDPSADVRDAAVQLLTESGAPAREAAEARLREPMLPELETTLRSFLDAPAKAPSDALSAR